MPSIFSQGPKSTGSIWRRKRARHLNKIKKEDLKFRKLTNKDYEIEEPTAEEISEKEGLDEIESRLRKMVDRDQKQRE